MEPGQKKLPAAPESAMPPPKCEETLIIEDESFQFTPQASQNQQIPFLNQEMLNSKLNESSFEQIYNLDREFSQLF